MSRAPEAKLSAEPPCLFPVAPPFGELHEVNMKIPQRSIIIWNILDMEKFFLKIFSLFAYVVDTRLKTPINILVTIFFVRLLVLLDF